MRSNAASISLILQRCNRTFETGLDETCLSDERCEALARANGMTPAQIALAWCHSLRFVGSTIIGATNLQQLQENNETFPLQLPEQVVNDINAIHTEITNPRQ